MSTNKDELLIPNYMDEMVTKAKKAQKEFERNYVTQRSVDEVVRAVGMAIGKYAQELSSKAVSETGMGNVEGKMYKLMGVSGNLWNFMKGKKSVGVIDDYSEPGIKIIAKPLGVIGCVMPSTNPLATIIGNTMMALKCRNAVIIAPHPASANVSELAVNYIRSALAEISAPVDLIQCIGVEEASIEATQEMLKQCDANIATGGAGMVKSVYSAGRPAFGVGQGNCQEIIDIDFTNLDAVAKASISNRSFDLGVPCTGDQTMHIPAEREKEYLDAMTKNGAYLIKEIEQINKIRELLFPNGSLAINRELVGKTPHQIGKLLSIDIPDSYKVILFKNQAKGKEDLLCKEILSPIIRYRTYIDFEEGVDAAISNLEFEGAGHSSSIWSNNQEHVDYVANIIPVGRFHVNQPTGGANNGTSPAITIGCGSWGNNSISENLSFTHLMNKTRVTTVLQKRKAFVPADWDDYEVYNIIGE